ncbi:MAG: hypothetical protein GIW99_08400 [Candidatus Eremiobacteraeota bacterium]|nr:hypothetical protein [Candidatus Eremiobacteraeota bacterium]MBC5827684.1 hypothetical protein [Candidatus Eremiobacteraeota bacterium]
MRIPRCLRIMGGSALALGIVATIGMAAPADRDAQVLASGHVYGTGEQQVYGIDRRATLTVRVRRHSGQIVSRVIHVDERLSIGLTVEGFDGTGAPVLALATAEPSSGTPAGSRSQVGAVSAGKGEAAAPRSQPSPSVQANGSITSGGSFAGLAPVALALSGAPGGFAEGGARWVSSALLRTPVADLAMKVFNAASAEPSDSSGVLVVRSQGNASVTGVVRLRDIGMTSLRGSSPVAASSYVETRRRLLLGAVVQSTGRGNAIVRGARRAAYTLSVRYVVKLLRYSGGIPNAPAPPPFGDASLGGAASPETNYRSPGPVSSIASAAPTDGSYVPSPLPTSPPTPPLGESLPPIPIALPGGQPIAVPPPAPTPTQS